MLIAEERHGLKNVKVERRTWIGRVRRAVAGECDTTQLASTAAGWAAAQSYYGYRRHLEHSELMLDLIGRCASWPLKTPLSHSKLASKRVEAPCQNGN
jgi:hypothetical protein